MPLALLVIGGVVCKNTIFKEPKYDNPWDKMLDTAAWVGGREYNADADNLTDRLTFDKPRKKD